MAQYRIGRSRSHSAIVLCIVIVLGLGSRKYSSIVPEIFGDYAGDAFWAIAAYVGVVLAKPGISYRRASIGALAIAFAVEFSQLYHAPWIDSVRNTIAGRLFLGSGFDSADLLAYGVGVSVGVLLDFVVLARQKRIVDVES